MLLLLTSYFKEKEEEGEGMKIDQHIGTALRLEEQQKFLCAAISV